MYTSKLSSTVSIILMILMLFNLAQLIIGYQEETKHNLKSSFDLFDRATSDPFYLSDSRLELAFFTDDDLKYDKDLIQYSLWQKHPCGFDVKNCPMDEYIGNLKPCRRNL